MFLFDIMVDVGMQWDGSIQVNNIDEMKISTIFEELVVTVSTQCRRDAVEFANNIENWILHWIMQRMKNKLLSVKYHSLAAQTKHQHEMAYVCDGICYMYKV